ncbi:MAG: Hpt domain-containing protein, partial [Nitrospirota bacterium]|nr:Hpt domain-containing protein [Nitrospirota bacterium]
MEDEMIEIRNDFLAETQEMLELLDQRFITLETDPNNTDLLNEIFRAMHSMKGSAGFLGFTRLVDVTHRAESILNKLRQGDMTVTPGVINVILETIDVVKLLMADIRESGTDQHVETDVMSNKLDLVLSLGNDPVLNKPSAGEPAKADAAASAPTLEPDEVQKPP